MFWKRKPPAPCPGAPEFNQMLVKLQSIIDKFDEHDTRTVRTERMVYRKQAKGDGDVTQSADIWGKLRS